MAVAGCLPAGPEDERRNIAGNIHFVDRAADLGDTLNRPLASPLRDTPETYNKPCFEAKIKDKTAAHLEKPPSPPAASQNLHRANTCFSKDPGRLRRLLQLLYHTQNEDPSL